MNAVKSIKTTANREMEWGPCLYALFWWLKDDLLNIRLMVMFLSLIGVCNEMFKYFLAVMAMCLHPFDLSYIKGYCLKYLCLFSVLLFYARDQN